MPFCSLASCFRSLQDDGPHFAQLLRPVPRRLPRGARLRLRSPTVVRSRLPQVARAVATATARPSAKSQSVACLRQMHVVGLHVTRSWLFCVAGPHWACAERPHPCARPISAERTPTILPPPRTRCIQNGLRSLRREVRQSSKGHRGSSTQIGRRRPPTTGIVPHLGRRHGLSLSCSDKAAKYTCVAT